MTTSFTFSCRSLRLRALEAELHVLGGERVAVVELQPLAQLELVGLLIRAHRPGFGEARRQVVARHRLHQRVVQRVQHPERREHADDLGRIEPGRRERHVERPAHLAFRLGLRRAGTGHRQGAQQDSQPRCQVSLPVHPLLLHRSLCELFESQTAGQDSGVTSTADVSRRASVRAARQCLGLTSEARRTVVAPRPGHAILRRMDKRRFASVERGAARARPADIAHAALFLALPEGGLHHRRSAFGGRRRRDRPHLPAVQPHDVANRRRRPSRSALLSEGAAMTRRGTRDQPDDHRDPGRPGPHPSPGQRPEERGLYPAARVEHRDRPARSRPRGGLPLQHQRDHGRRQRPPSSRPAHPGRRGQQDAARPSLW